MNRSQWQAIGLFAGMVAVVAAVDMDVARKLVLVVGFVILLTASPLIARAVNSVIN
jgi:hypothetical protein